ncbi:putative 14 kDa proline-rich protein DC2.15 [Melia azedarach]|uniref:14 kDa proline-rich protein DC2.15 n=1 Tax=Melia azedarach TaxID=155640 RepID=A0ACC1WZE1_MELAZ|nr:putative 14 kDa proline-rich protein DC2.15 [Melia azedarach]
MGSKAAASTALLLSLNLIFFTLLTSIPSSSASSEILNSKPKPTAAAAESCKDKIKLDLCVGLLNDSVSLEVGNPDHPCCSLLGDLVRLEGRACGCISINLNLLNLVHLNIPNLGLELLVSSCKSKLPPGFQCS